MHLFCCLISFGQDNQHKRYSASIDGSGSHEGFRVEYVPLYGLGWSPNMTFVMAMGSTCNPFAWDLERRFSLRCKLIAAFFNHCFITCNDVKCILDTFNSIKHHEEQEFGESRTKRVILEMYGEYAEGIARNKPDDFKLTGDDSAIPAGDYPAVPALLTIAGLLEYLSRLGVQVDNNRVVGGNMWVYKGKAEFGKLADLCRRAEWM